MVHAGEPEVVVDLADADQWPGEDGAEVDLLVLSRPGRRGMASILKSGPPGQSAEHCASSSSAAGATWAWAVAVSCLWRKHARVAILMPKDAGPSGWSQPSRTLLNTCMPSTRIVEQRQAHGPVDLNAAHLCPSRAGRHAGRPDRYAGGAQSACSHRAHQTRNGPARAPADRDHRILTHPSPL